jgi:hypothetical protein
LQQEDFEQASSLVKPLARPTDTEARLADRGEAPWWKLRVDCVIGPERHNLYFLGSPDQLAAIIKDEEGLAILKKLLEEVNWVQKWAATSKDKKRKYMEITSRLRFVAKLQRSSNLKDMEESYSRCLGSGR